MVEHRHASNLATSVLDDTITGPIVDPDGQNLSHQQKQIVIRSSFFRIQNISVTVYGNIIFNDFSKVQDSEEIASKQPIS